MEGLGHAKGEGPKVEGENVKKGKYFNLNDTGCDGISFGQRLLFSFFFWQIEESFRGKK